MRDDPGSCVRVLTAKAPLFTSPVKFASLRWFADRLFLPSALVLDDCGITKAGDGSYIAAFCAHVLELDLSHNQLNDWVEVSVLKRVHKSDNSS